jgi:8-oxo-dGTP diphosphatase
VVGIVERAGRFLVSRRLPRSHLAGLWEFPGGKVRPGEALEDALRREIAEEVQLSIRQAILLEVREHTYPERAVLLHFFLCPGVEGEPRAGEGQEVRWATAEEITRLEVPAANRRVIQLLAEQYG